MKHISELLNELIQRIKNERTGKNQGLGTIKVGDK